MQNTALKLEVSLAPSTTCRWCDEDIADHPRQRECSLADCGDCGEPMLVDPDGDPEQAPIFCEACVFQTNAVRSL